MTYRGNGLLGEHIPRGQRPKSTKSVSPERSENCEAISLEVCSMRGAVSADSTDSGLPLAPFEAEIR